MYTIELDEKSKDIKIGNSENFHVQEVQVFTGNDDYRETEMYSHKMEGEKLKCLKALDHDQLSPYRTRYEPAVKMILKSEEDHELYQVTISHHKGRIQAHALKLESKIF